MNLREFQHGAELAGAQARAAALFSLYGIATPGPRLDEDLGRYRRRLLETASALLPSNSPWRGVPVSRQPDSALDSVETHLLDGQVTAFKAPIGPLRSTTEVDDSGRRLRRFYGDPANVWERFAGARRVVTGFSKAGRGADSPHAREVAAARAACLRENGLL